MTTMRCLMLAAVLVLGCSAQDDGAIVARGTVELPEIDLSPPVGSRVVSIRVDEGSVVAAGDTVALLSQAELPGSLAAQQARVAAARANVRDLEAGARPEEIKRAEADAAAAAAEAERTAADLVRAERLYSEQVIARQQLDNARTAASVARERTRAAEETLRVVRAGARRDRVAGAQADLANAQAALAMVEARAADLVLIAPVAGRILIRSAEPGEFLGPGTPVLTLGETARPWVRVFVPAARIGEISVGRIAEILVDGTDTVLGSGRVVAVNTRAEFTPRVALTEAERADLMFGVKVELTAPPPGAHPGLWVSVRFAAPAGPAAASR